MTYPDLRPSTTGHWPPRISDVPRGIPVLGEHMMGAKGRGLVMGWTPLPPAEWKPEDLIWRPPGTKTLDLAGVIAEVKTFDGSDHAWVVSQLAKRDRWLEILRQKVLDGSMQLTAALAKALGIPFHDGVDMKDRSRVDPGERAMRELAQLYAQTGGRN